MSSAHKQSILDVVGRNPVHPFPARMAPGIALEAVSNSKKRLKVLDPMMGSGTVLAVARANGHSAIGFDLDPLAVLLSRVWIQVVDSEAVMAAASSVLRSAEKSFEGLAVGEAYPAGADGPTRKFIRYWFDPYARRQLTSLSNSIRRVRNVAFRDVMWVAFSRLIISKSTGASLAMDLSHSRPHKTFKTAPIKPFNKFLDCVEAVCRSCIPSTSKVKGPRPTVRRGDARVLPIRSGSVDLVVTSPPYLNAIDYMRCSKFSLVWMGFSVDQLRHIRTTSIGSEKSQPEAAWTDKMIGKMRLKSKMSQRDRAVLARYIEDMYEAVSEVARVLKRGGKAVYVVGNSTIRGSFVRNSAIVASVASTHGLLLERQRARTLPNNRRYLPPPSNASKPGSLDLRMRQEVILEFKKSRASQKKVNLASKRRSLRS